MSGDPPHRRAPRGPGRPFAKGTSGNPAGRRSGSRNKATLAAAALLAGEAEALTRKAVEMALQGDPLALRLCLERIVPRCRERPVSFDLPRIVATHRDSRGPSPQELSRALNAVAAALARGEITPGEAATVAEIIDRFVHAIATSKRDEVRYGLLQILAMGGRNNGDDDDGVAEYGRRRGH